MKKSLRYIVAGIVVLLIGGFVIADTVNQEKQILADGNMENAGVGDWAASNSATLTKETGAVEDGTQILRVAYSDTENPAALQTMLTVGKTYRLTGWARSDGGAVPRVLTPAAGITWTGTNSTDWQYFDITGTTGYTSINLRSTTAGAGYTEWDDILVTEYTPPIANAEDELLADGDMEEDGTDIPFMKKFDLTQAANITADSGAITGALTYTCAGAEFDGTNDYVTYTVPTTLFSTNPSISIVMEFTPDFDYDADNLYFLCSSTANHEYDLYKWNNAGNNTLSVTLGDTAIADIPSATYSAYWKVNERNVLVVSGNGTLTNAWLNGTQILTNDNTAWVAKSPTGFYVGAYNDGTFKFDGEIHAVSIYSGLLDGTDATNLYNSVDTSDWTATTSACLTKQLGAAESGSQVLRVAWGGESWPKAQQSVFDSGTTYRATGWARSDGTATPQVMVNTGQIFWTGVNTHTNWQYFDEIETPNGTLLYLLATINEASSVEFDDVLITEYTPPMVNDYSQMIVDGDMELAGVTNWSVVHAVRTKEAGAADDGAQVIRVTATADAGTRYPQISQTLLTVGETYRIMGRVRSDGTETPWVFNSPGTLWTGTTSTDWQYFDVVYEATNAQLSFVFALTGPAGTEYVEWDDIFVTLVEPQYNYYGQLLVDGDMEAGDTSAWTAVSNAILSKESTDPQSGSLSMRIAYDDTSLPFAKQTILTAGQEYRVTGWARGDGTAAPYLGDGTTALWSGTNSASWQAFDETFTAINTDLRFRSDATASNYVEFDGVVLTRTD